MDGRVDDHVKDVPSHLLVKTIFKRLITIKPYSGRELLPQAKERPDLHSSVQIDRECFALNICT